MPALSRIRRSRGDRERPWAQISFLDAGGALGVGNTPHEVEDALGAADRAADSASRRNALDRLYGSLAQRALRRGRTPVPKRSDGQDQR